MHITSFLSVLTYCLAVTANPLSSANARNSPNPVRKTSSSSGKRAVGYYGNWDIYARNFTITDIQADQFTHIVYSFANINNATGEVVLSDTWADLQYAYPGDDTSANGTNLYGNAKQLYLLKKKNRSLKTMLSIAGWTYSPNMIPVLASSSMRSTFAQTAVKHMYNLGFDGLNIDYEYVTSATQAKQLTDLLRRLRSEMSAYAKNTSSTPFLLSFAAPAGPLKYTLLDFQGMDPYLDFWDFMSFDYAGSWDTISGHSSNLYPDLSNPASTPFNTTTAIQYYISVGGISPSKINLGSPLYGHAFSGTSGPGTPFNGTGNAGSFGEAGIWDYKALPISNCSPIVTELPNLGASYSYDAEAKYMISYDTPNIAKQKARWIEKMGLGGAMWWEISMDKGGEESLVAATVEVFGGLEGSENHLEYPLSEYGNLGVGMIDGVAIGSKGDSWVVAASAVSTSTALGAFTSSSSCASPTPTGSGGESLEASLARILQEDGIFS